MNALVIITTIYIQDIIEQLFYKRAHDNFLARVVTRAIPACAVHEPSMHKPFVREPLSLESKPFCVLYGYEKLLLESFPRSICRKDELIETGVRHWQPSVKIQRFHEDNAWGEKGAEHNKVANLIS